MNFEERMKTKRVKKKAVRVFSVLRRLIYQARKNPSSLASLAPSH